MERTSAATWPTRSFECPDQISFEVPDNTHIVVKGISKERVGQVVTDEQVGQAELLLQILHEVENLSLHQDVQMMFQDSYAAMAHRVNESSL